MNSDELELAKEVSKELVKQTLAPVQEIVRELSGPAATEIGLMLGDFFRVWRLKRVVRYLGEVREVASRAGLRLKPVAPRVLFPILDSASLEDNEDLHQRWIALLTNAASDSNNVLPYFPDFLKQLTSEDAQFLDRTYDTLTLQKESWRIGQLWGELGPVRINTADTSPITIENLKRLSLVSWVRIESQGPESGHLYITKLGEAFIHACRLPRASNLAQTEAGITG